MEPFDRKDLCPTMSSKILNETLDEESKRYAFLEPPQQCKPIFKLLRCFQEDLSTHNLRVPGKKTVKKWHRHAEHRTATPSGAWTNHTYFPSPEDWRSLSIYQLLDFVKVVNQSKLIQEENLIVFFVGIGSKSKVATFVISKSQKKHLKSRSPGSRPSPKRKGSSSNRPFSGVFAVSFKDGSFKFQQC